MKYFIDTNIFLRYYIGDNKKMLNDTRELFSLFQRKRIHFVTCNIVLSEIEWVTRSFYEINKEDIALTLKTILSSPGLTIVRNYDEFFAINLFEKTNAKFDDCLIASIPEVKNKECVVISYDKDFDKLKVKRREPCEITRLLKND